MNTERVDAVAQLLAIPDPDDVWRTHRIEREACEGDPDSMERIWPALVHIWTARQLMERDERKNAMSERTEAIPQADGDSRGVEIADEPPDEDESDDEMNDALGG